jgi:hypothetical protein
MPECKPKAGENKNDFISRCVKIAMNDGKNQNQALGQCYGIWNNTKKAEKKIIDNVKKSVKEMSNFLKDNYGN